MSVTDDPTSVSVVIPASSPAIAVSGKAGGIRLTVTAEAAGRLIDKLRAALGEPCACSLGFADVCHRHGKAVP